MAKTFQLDDLAVEFELREMTADVGAVIKLDPARVATIAESYGDSSPEFAVIRIEGGKVSGNGNDFLPSVFKSVAKQINNGEKPGYLGHVNPKDRGYVFPDPQLIWLAAQSKTEHGKPVLYAKGYMIEGTQGKKHIKSGLARTFSWAGKANGRIVGGIRKVEEFLLDSIDISRPGGNGMSAALVGITTEMEGSEETVDWATATLADIRAGNPSLFDLMKLEVTKENAAHITEMEGDAEYGKEAKGTLTKLRDILGLGDKDDLVEHVTEMQTERANRSTQTLREKIGVIVKEKVKRPEARDLVLDAMPLTEMVGLSDDDLKKKVEGEFDTNDKVKFVVTEMDGAPAPLTHRGRGGSIGSGDKSKVGKSGHVRQTTNKL